MVQVFGSAPVQDLRDRGAEPHARRWGIRNILLVAEVALSIVALVTAGLFFRSFENARRIAPGSRPTSSPLVTSTSARRVTRPNSQRCSDGRSSHA
jgi:hypothetical protein